MPKEKKNSHSPEEVSRFYRSKITGISLPVLWMQDAPAHAGLEKIVVDQMARGLNNKYPPSLAIPPKEAVKETKAFFGFQSLNSCARYLRGTCKLKNIPDFGHARPPLVP